MNSFKKIVKFFINKVRTFFFLLEVVLKPKIVTDKKIAFLFKISKWKQPFIPYFLKEYKIIYVPNKIKVKILKFVLQKYNNIVFIVWGYNEDKEIYNFAMTHNIPLYRLEDGFLRSKGLGAMHTPPYSICLDKKGMYFDSSEPSDLEDILNNYDFQSNCKLIQYAEKYINEIIKDGISKYNHVGKKNINEIYGIRNKKRVLVIGQVEDDASIKKGANKRWTNNDIVKLAKDENPGSQIIYKPHPDVLTGRRKKQSNPEDVRNIALIIDEPLSLSDSFETIDHVYTITSLAGFEAILRGIPVTTLGAPFYSGWGLTDDRQKVGRRKRKLTKEELFIGAYYLYPRYANPYTGETISLEDTLKLIK